ncbi:Uu.00g018340.m01.CDS01 [Anthostomella pinea]|uniref:DNA-directed RNA polymerase n=1 Tax=Anthostomella pinea TaxID=933095 RepID=A0AAI8YQN9_9PEZI|nr:Uu.00g018340.m01.CDS01 [Anthostomella pinea]
MLQDDIPFDSLRSPAPNNYMQPPPRLQPYHLRGFDPNLPLLVRSKEDPFPRARTTNSGVPGGVDEMLSVFDACLQVDKLDRAALVLERFGDMGALPDSDLIALHNQYLRRAIDRAFAQPQSEWAQSLHTWYEVQIRGKNIPQTPETIACMLKVSLLSTQGPRLERLVERYMDMMPDESIYQLAEEGILNQQDFGIITSIYQPASDLTFDDWEGLPEATEPETHCEGLPTDLSTQSELQRNLEVLSVPQKGLGLKTLRGVLSFFDKIKGQDLSKLSVDQRREIQGQLERDCVDAAINRWREEHQALMKMGRNTSLSTNALNSQLYDWQCSLEKKLENEFASFGASEERDRKSQEDMDRCMYAPFMKQSTPTRLAAVTIMSVLNSLASNGADKGVQLSVLLNQLSKSIEEDVKFQQRHKDWAARKAKFGKPSRNGATRQSQGAAKSPTADQPNTTQPDTNIVDVPVYDTRNWPVLIRTKIGAALLSALLDSAKVKVVREHPETKELVSQTQPALAHTTVNRKGKKIGVVIPNKFLVDLMKREPRGDFLARHLPMLVEPEPWTKFDKGGFLEYPSQLVRVKHGEKDQRVYAEAAVQRGDMEQVSKGLDVLGRTAWQVNKPVFDVMLEAWNSGEKLANIPPLDPQIPIPIEPEASEDPLHRRQWLKRVRMVENEKSGLHSERCFMNFQLEIANAFQDQTFYFPHNMDFRGRAYPLPTYLNHMGADHVRGLLRFATGKELGESGLRWLKVHLANVFGYDKASLREREAFATDHLEDIIDSATNPLTGNRWWLKAEDAWQCLAACYELKAALGSPEPTKYVSHLPVHQDGTCNGLQHYAALGGDLWGAQQVNLEPGDRPADVYSAVADLVKESIAQDLKDDSFLAKAVDGKITRKVVKQTVMTNVYGVTFVGARNQVLKQIDAAYPHIQEETGIPAMLLASYVATKIFKALSSMFRGAHDIQYWLGECAGRVCRALTPEQLDRLAAAPDVDAAPKKKTRSTKAAPKKSRATFNELISQCRSTIVWTTPLRMPVVQPYRKSGTRVIPTCLQDLTLQIPERSDPVNRRKQLQAFPPNFIHSLDASHMLLSALECDELGLSFAAVHDSFWTHAADTDVMNRVLRDAFIRIHGEDVIGRLASEFKARYKGSLYLATLNQDSDVEKRITQLRSQGRLSLKDELFQERERQRLLASSDPEEVQKGRDMVTPATIYEEFAASQPSTASAEMEQVGLGNIPDGTVAGQLGVVEEEEDADDAENSLSAAGVDAPETDLESDDETETERAINLMNMSDFEATLSGERTKKPAVRRTAVNIWLPLTFPEIPKKGDFDVNRLKSSQYFFS